MKSTFEKLGGTYKQVGDYLLPDVEAPESPKVGALGAAAAQVSARVSKGALYGNASH